MHSAYKPNTIENAMIYLRAVDRSYRQRFFYVHPISRNPRVRARTLHTYPLADTITNSRRHALQNYLISD